MEKNKLSLNSSLLVSNAALVVWTVFMALSAVAGYSVLAGLFLFFLLLFSFARYWTWRAMQGLSLDISCHRRRLFPGMETVIEYEVKNDKLLPLVWLELSQLASERNCLTPDESFEECEGIRIASEDIELRHGYKRCFSLIMGYETLKLSSVWTARCRGIYRSEKLLLRSGDGFGLSQSEMLYPPELLPEIVVYPRRVSVDASRFLRRDWDKSFGKTGYKEDLSVLRGLRPYTNSDSWKRINWRMAARQPGELNVNFYETVQPASALFILDGESFYDDAAALEDTLEIMASLIDVLCSKGVSCGLCLPKSRDHSALNISPQQGINPGELLYYLAGYEVLNEPVRDKEGRETGKCLPSAFALRGLGGASMEAGTAAVFTKRPDELSPKLLEKLEAGRSFVFSAGALDCPDKRLPISHINVLRGRTET